MGHVRYASWAEMRAVDEHEAALRRADRRDGGTRYATFRRQQDAAFRAALAADRRERRARRRWG